MNDREISARALDSLIANTERLPSSPVVDEGLTWLRQQRASLNSPKRQRFVFRLDAPSYVTLGREGEERAFVHPGFAGLDYAWQILFAGVTVQHILHATDLLGYVGKQPGNALDGALRRAADWIEYQADCPPLAATVRSISVSKVGAISYDPARRPEIILL